MRGGQTARGSNSQYFIGEIRKVGMHQRGSHLIGEEVRTHLLGYMLILVSRICGLKVSSILFGTCCVCWPSSAPSGGNYTNMVPAGAATPHRLNVYMGNPYGPSTSYARVDRPLAASTLLEEVLVETR